MQGPVYSHTMARRGRPNVTIRLDEDLWARFGQLTSDRSAAVREFIRWYVREPGAKLPRRPELGRSSDA